jgi:formylglycine-generating enzyme required for sulfatase activity
VKARPAAAAAAWLTLACMVLMGAVLWLTAGAGAGSKDPPAIPPRIPESQQARLVAIETEPPDALVAVVRVSDETGEPDPNDVLRPSRRTPLSLTLEPGRYLLEVEVPDHGFHQVYRTVPSVDEKPLGPFYFHSSWELDGHIVKLPVIRIPRTADVIKDMEWLEGGEFTMGSDQWMIATFPHRRKIEAYYLDRIEVTIGQARRVNLSLPEQLANLGSARDDDPLTYISHTAALHYAEIVGKRLPTEAEYEYPATNRGADPFPWGQEVPAIWDTAEFWPYGPVAARAFDVTRLAPSIRGLYSGVAEWTDSMYTMYPGAWEYVELQARQVGQMAPPPPVFRDARVIRGGGMAVARGEANEDVWHRDARWREAIFKEHALPGLGFRCARSAAPRYVRAGN